MGGAQSPINNYPTSQRDAHGQIHFIETNLSMQELEQQREQASAERRHTSPN